MNITNDIEYLAAKKQREELLRRAMDLKMAMARYEADEILRKKEEGKEG